MIVGSRTAEYNALRAYWGMDNALVLAPIDDDVLDHYLAPPDNFAALRRQLATSAASRKLAETPYWIAMMAYVYQDAAELHLPADQMEQIEAIHTAYIDKQLAQSAKQHAQYSRTEIDKYLRWLAWKMKENGVTLFAPDMINLRWAGGGIQEMDQWMLIILAMGGGLLAPVGGIAAATGMLAGGGGWYIVSRLAARHILKHNGTLPHNLPAFLDEMVALGLLRKVDKHYLFLHDNLRHYHFYWPMLLETEKQKKKKST
jgi:hypothetical protein